MNNTIPNVPRELEPCPFCGGKAHAIAENAAKRQPEVVMCLACLGEIEGAGAIDKWNARTLSAPSPAGVDGLEVFITDCATCIDVVPARTVTDARVVLAKDAQAIIDGLRGEVEDLRAESFESLYNAVIDERDQQAQRIGELEGLLRESGKTIHKLQAEQPTPARIARYLDAMRGQIDAALSAGKEGE